ncbi:7789_t:CDS:2 [Funneliformis mosseae]|uniref:7789_t:CDS:1 n=1 Tax=Funneliformis mosseae TaxID=27381 RepID=A0A9N8YNC7_FUNMO|nr:7789_t:CDS:2 [Funneliformis mosseae]
MTSGYTFYTSGAPQQPGEATWKYHIRKLFTIKTLDTVESDQNTSELNRTLGAWDIIMIGIGGIIGTGIFVLTGQAAANNAGPAVLISFIISGLASAFAALSYSEIASMIPVAGSAYTYTYATLGELLAWIIGWDLILEYFFGSASIAVGFSGYFVHFFENAFNVHFSPSWTAAPLLYNETTSAFEKVPGSYFNVPAFAIIIFLTIILIVGIRESANFNTGIVGIKVLILILFVIAGSTRITNANYKPYVPPNEGKFSEFGFTGVLSGATVVFFAYIGFDSVSTTAQEVKNPQRNLPIGIIGSLVICTVLYMAVSTVLTGIVPFRELDGPAPISTAAEKINMRWLGIVVDLGAMLGLISGNLVTLLGQTRIFYSMAHDGLIIKSSSKIHPRFKTPYIITAFTGIFCAIASALLPIDILTQLTSVGTLFAFLLVNVGVVILRIYAPDAPRKFKIPGGPYLVPIIGSLFDIVLLASAHKAAIVRLFIWMAIGLVIYFVYGRRNSTANNKNEPKVEKREAINTPNSDGVIEMINVVDK